MKDNVVLITTISLIIIFSPFFAKILKLLFWWFSKVSLALMPHEDNKEQDIRLSR